MTNIGKCIGDLEYPLLFFRHSPVKQSGVCYGQSKQAIQHSAEEVSSIFIKAYQHWKTIQGAPLADEPSIAMHIWTSPSPRCHAPAKQIAEDLNLMYEIDPRLYELSFGDWEGLSWSDIEQTDPIQFQKWMDHWKTEAPPNGETLKTFQRRILEWQVELNPQTQHCVVGHAGVLRSLLVNMKLMTWDEAMSLSIPHMKLLQLDPDKGLVMP